MDRLPPLPPAPLGTPIAASMIPHRGVLIGVDHGQKRIGIAVTDAAQTMSLPVETIAVKSPGHNAEQFRRLMREYRPVGWVVGLPLHMSGEESPQSGRARQFGQWLAELSHLPLVFWDERLSSSTAETLLWSMGASPSRDKARIDGLAAQVLLEAYLQGRAAAPLAANVTPTPPTAPIETTELP